MIEDGTKKFKDIWNGKLPDMSDISDVIMKKPSNAGFDTVYQNMMTGKVDSVRDNVLRYEKNNIYLSSIQYKGVDIRLLGYYVAYNKKHDVLVMYFAHYDYTEPEDGEIRGWKDITPSFVFTRNGDVYSNDKNAIGEDSLPPANVRDMREENVIYGNNETETIHFHTTSYDIVKKFYGDAVVVFMPMQTMAMMTSNYQMVDTTEDGGYTALYNISRCDYHIVKTSEQKSPKMEEMLSYELKDISKKRFLPYFQTLHYNDKIFGVETTKKYQQESYAIVVLQKIKDDISVLRTFCVCAHMEDIQTKKFTADDLETYETKRVYLEGYNEPTVCVRYLGKWYASKEEGASRYIADDSFLLPWKPDDSYGTALENFDDYIEKMLDDAGLKNVDTSFHRFNVQEATVRILSVVGCPYAKSLFEAFFDDIHKAVILSTRTRIFSAVLGAMFGIDRTYEREFLAPFGANLMDAVQCPQHMIKTFDERLFELFEKYDDVNQLLSIPPDDDTFQLYVKSFATIRSYFREAYPYFRNMNTIQFEELMDIYLDVDDIRTCAQHDIYSARCIRQLVGIYGPKNIKSYMLYVFKELPEITKSIKDGVITRHMYYDYILTCHKLADKFDDFEKPKWKLKNAQDIKNYHDEMAYIYNMKTDEAEMRRSEEAFKQVKDNWNDFLYEEDEFSVIAPKKAMDIAREGIVLNHCVKTYLEDVLEGKTNILFIRNTEEIDKPFYTLEVKDGAVRQCHGFCNCNVSETEGLQEFLERYCKEKHIELEDTDRVLAVE